MIFYKIENKLLRDVLSDNKVLLIIVICYIDLEFIMNGRQILNEKLREEIYMDQHEYFGLKNKYTRSIN